VRVPLFIKRGGRDLCAIDTRAPANTCRGARCLGPIPATGARAIPATGLRHCRMVKAMASAKPGGAPSANRDQSIETRALLSGAIRHARRQPPPINVHPGAISAWPLGAPHAQFARVNLARLLTGHSPAREESRSPISTPLRLQLESVRRPAAGPGFKASEAPPAEGRG